jgi:formylmethanofuran dehydrogenase subunit A
VAGYRYAKLGYTTVMEAAVPPLGARHAHEELVDTPIIDKGAFMLMGSNHFVLKYIQENEFEKLKNFVAFLLKATRGYAIKMVNPGGVENWKWGRNVGSLNDKVENYDVTPREIITSLARVNEELKLPHSVHVHCNNLGVPGNFKTTLETIGALKERIHITHIQFNSYAGEDWTTFSSGAPEIADCINRNEHVTCDIGQVIFGSATTMTADGPWQHTLYKLTGNKWYNSDVEMEAGAGIVPYVFRKKSAVNAIQWAIGLELFLLIKDPWKVHLTTDHPNAGPFYRYPRVISWLMSKGKRDELLKKAHKAASSKTTLPNIDREYSLYEIATITRASTAKALGLKNKGHLGRWADADVAIYEFDEKDIEGSFSRPKYVIKGGEIVVKDGEVVKAPEGRTFWVDAGGEATDEIRETFSKYYTINFENYPVQDEYLPRGEVIRCR